MADGIERTQRRAWLLAAVGLGAAGGAVAVPAALAAPSRPIAISDPAADVSGALDITRVALQRAADGRLRASISFAAKLTPRTLLAASGPPGSACVRIWTDAGVDPAVTRADRLVCVTARSARAFRGGVYEVVNPGLPTRVADASTKLSSSGRSLALRFAQSSLGRPQRIRFAFESTRPGCALVSCIDSAPDGGKARTFRLR